MTSYSGSKRKRINNHILYPLAKRRKLSYYYTDTHHILTNLFDILNNKQLLEITKMAIIKLLENNNGKLDPIISTLDIDDHIIDDLIKKFDLHANLDYEADTDDT